MLLVTQIVFTVELMYLKSCFELNVFLMKVHIITGVLFLGGCSSLQRIAVECYCDFYNLRDFEV